MKEWSAPALTDLLYLSLHLEQIWFEQETGHQVVTVQQPASFKFALHRPIRITSVMELESNQDLQTPGFFS